MVVSNGNEPEVHYDKSAADDRPVQTPQVQQHKEQTEDDPQRESPGACDPPSHVATPAVKLENNCVKHSVKETPI